MIFFIELLVPLVKSEEFPHFTWVVKDFVQDLEGQTPSTWLQQFMKKHRDRGLDEFGGKGLDSIFKTIECQTLFLPGIQIDINITQLLALSQAQLQDLSRVTSEQLTPEFKQGVRVLKDRVTATLSSKHTKQNVPLNGPSFSSLVKFLVASANENQFPELPSLFDSWVTKLTGK